jgi:hypothetical protein
MPVVVAEIFQGARESARRYHPPAAGIISSFNFCFPKSCFSPNIREAKAKKVSPCL